MTLAEIVRRAIQAALGKRKPKQDEAPMREEVKDKAEQLRKTETDYRRHVVLNARAELGKKDAEVYHREAMAPGTKAYPKHWCQAFFLSMLKRSGVGLELYARQGVGFEALLRRAGIAVVYERDPQPGDLAYFDKLQHHAIVERVDGAIISLLQGNGKGGKVTESRCLRKDITLCYSIDPLIQRAIQRENDETPTLVT